MRLAALLSIDGETVTPVSGGDAASIKSEFKALVQDPETHEHKVLVMLTSGGEDRRWKRKPVSIPIEIEGGDAAQSGPGTEGDKPKTSAKGDKPKPAAKGSK